jgi:hypothetical protein
MTGHLRTTTDVIGALQCQQLLAASLPVPLVVVLAFIRNVARM